MGTKEEASQLNIGYHVDVRMRNPDDFHKNSTPTSSTTPTSIPPYSSSSPSSKAVSKSVMITNPKHGHVRHTYDLTNHLTGTATAHQQQDEDTASSSSSDPSTATSSSSTATATSTSTSSSSSEALKGPLTDFITINSPAASTKARSGSKPNFFRLPDGTIVFPIEIPVGVKSKYNNKDISLVVSVARVMQPPTGVGVSAAGGLTASGRFLGDNLSFPGLPSTAQQHITSATKLEKLLSTQYPQYWQYSQYSRGGVGNALPPPVTDSKAANFHNSYSNPNLFGMGGNTVTRSQASAFVSGLTSGTTPSTLLGVPTLSSSNSRSDPNLSSLASTALESGDTLSPLPNLTSNTLAPPTTGMTSRGSSGNLYGMGQLQTTTSSSTLSLANTGGAQLGSMTSTSTFNSNFTVNTSGPVAIKTAQKIVRVIEPLQVRLLQHYTAGSLKMGTKRLIPVAVSNTHPTLPITVRGLQLVLSNIPSLEGGNSLAAGPVPDIPYHYVSVTDKYKTSTLDIETFPVSIDPGDEYQFVVTVEPNSPSSVTSSVTPPPPPAPSRSGIAPKRRVIHTLQAQLVITWSIPCSPGSILSMHPLPVSFPDSHDLLVSFDSKSPVRAHNVFNVCFTITNLSNYSRDLTFFIPRPVCVTNSSTTPSTPSASTLLPRSASQGRSPPTRSNTLPSFKFTAASSSTTALPSFPSSFVAPTPTRAPSFTTTSSYVPPPSAPSPLSSSSPLPPVSSFTSPTSVTPEDDMLIRFGELQANSASMLCLEKTLYVGLVKSNSSVSVNVRYIPLRAGLFSISGLQILDRANEQVYHVQDTCQLYVIA